MKFVYYEIQRIIKKVVVLVDYHNVNNFVHSADLVS